MRVRNRYPTILAIMCAAVLLCAAAGADEIALTWEDAVSRALSFHPQVISALKAEEAAERAYEKAAAAYAPQLTLTSRPASSGNRQDSAGKFHRYTESETRLTAGATTSFGLSGSAAVGQAWSENFNKSRTFLSVAASANLDPKGRLYSSSRLALEKARVNSRKASWDRQEQVQSTALSVLATFWRLELDAKRLDITRESRQRQADIYARTLERQKLGLATDTDILEAEIEWFQAEVAEQKTEAEYRTRLLTLARDLELPADLVLVPSGGFPEPDLVAAFDRAALEKAAGELSLAVRKRRLDVDYSTLELKQAEAARWPDIVLAGNYSIPDTAKTDTAVRPWGVYINVELPILDGGRRRLSLADKQADLQSAQTALTRDQEGTLSALQQKLTNWEIACRHVEIARLKLKHAQLEETMKSRQYAAGLVSDSALRSAQTDALLAAVDLQDALHAQALAQMEIETMAGKRPTIGGKQLLP